MTEYKIPDEPLPWSSEAEARVLGIIMHDNGSMERLDFLLAEHFYGSLHQQIFAECRLRIRNGELANPVTLRVHFSSDPDCLNGRYLVQCVALSERGVLDLIGLANYIKSQAERRELILACDKAKISLLQEKDIIPISEALSDVCERIMAKEKRFEMQKGSSITQAIMDNLGNKKKPHPTGIKRLDKAMAGGIYQGKLYGFAGKKKFGKTVLAGTISVNLAMHGTKHLFICGEMSAEEVQERNLARVGEFYSNAFKEDSQYNSSANFKEKLLKSVQWQQDNIIFVNAPGLTFDRLKYIVKQAVLRYGISGYILDYWQLVGGKDSKKSSAEHLDEVAQWMADSAKKYNIFALAMAQINQEGNTRGGEGIRLACDQLYQIQRPNLDQPPMWLEMMDTRYTKWMNIGEKDFPEIFLNDKGPYFEEGELSSKLPVAQPYAD